MNGLRYAIRSMRRSPGLAAVAIGSLALGIGANTAIFSVANALILRSLPARAPNELVVFRYTSKKGNVFDNFGYTEYTALRDTPGALSNLAAESGTDLNISSDEATERVSGEFVSGSYFATLGLEPRVGRLIEAADDAPGNPVCVISYRLWQRRFGSSAAIAGRKIQLNGSSFTVLGVAPENYSGLGQATRAEIFVPMTMAGPLSGAPTELPPFEKFGRWVQLIGRRAPGVSRERAEAILDAKFAQLPLANLDFTFESSSRHGAPGSRIRLSVLDGRQGFDDLRNTYQRPIVFLLFLVGLLLLIACANVASLLAARAAGQRKQIAIRLALGASRWDLLRQQLAESSILAGAGAVAGLLLSSWMADVLVKLTPESDQLDVHFDWRVLLFLIGTSAVTTLLFGIFPALESGKTGVGAALKNESSGVGRRRGILSSALVCTQVALSVTLLAGAGLLLRSLHNLESIPLGFQPEHIVVASLDPGANQYDKVRTHTLFETLMQRAESIPGVRASSAAVVSPLSGTLYVYSVNIPGVPAKPTPMAYANAIGPGFFATIGARLVRGREFTYGDREGAPKVVIVNEQMAKKYWPGRDPIGERFKSAIGGKDDLEIVGVVHDSIYRNVRETQPDVLYTPLLQSDQRAATLHLRVAGDPSAVFGELRALARSVDAGVPLYQIRTMSDQIAGTLSPERMLASVSTILGGLAILLAMVGLYSILANAVAQRAREIGIRMALGSGQGRVIGMILRDTARLVLIGVVVGIPLSLGASKWIQSFLFGIKPQDPWTYLAIVAVVITCGMVAAFVPSRRASRVDPMSILRQE